MAERIKGITVEIGGETSGLDKALKGVNDTSRSLQSELKDVQRLLKFDPNNAELLAQKQKLLNNQIENTGDKLKQLREAQAQVQAQFEKGDIGADQYRAFQREIADTEITLRHTETALANMTAEQERTADSTKQLERIFELTGSTVEDFADVLGDRLTNSIKNGTANSKDLQKAFDLIGKEAVGSEDNVEKLRKEIEQLEQGEKSVEQVRKEFKKLEKQVDEAKTSVKEAGSELGNMAAGAAAGVGIGGIVAKALETETLDTTIDITFDLDDQGTRVVKEAINTVKAYGVDGEAALDGVRRQWAQNADVSDEANARIIKGAGMITHAYGEIDFTELIQETNEMSSELGMTQEQALGMTNQLLKAGFPPDQIDIISEYGGQLARAGYTWEEIQGIINSGANVDSWNIDNLLDGLQEGRILIAEFGTGISESMQKTLEGTNISAEQLQNWGKAVAEGGESGKQAYNEVAQALAGVQDKTKQNELGVALYGTMWETQGTNILDTILNAGTLTANAGENQKAYNADIAALDSSPIVMLQDAIAKMNEVLQPVYELIANVIAKIAEWMVANPAIAATIAAVVVAIGLLIGICLALMPIFATITGLAGALGVAVGAVAAPFLIAIGIILAVIAIGVLLWQNWDWLEKKAGQLSRWIGQQFRDFKEKVAEEMAETWRKIKEAWGKAEKFLKDVDLVKIGEDIIGGLLRGIGTKARELYTKAQEIATKVSEKLKGAFKTGSPSKVTMSIGEDVGDGLTIGLGNTIGQLQSMSEKMAAAALPNVPKQSATTAAPATTSKPLTVNIHSPKAVDAREASRIFNRQLNKMSVLW